MREGQRYMSYSLNSLKGGILGTTTGLSKGGY